MKENQASFEKEVFGPPMLTCSVKDNRYSDLVQSLLQGDDFLCFSAQTKEDHKKLSDQFYNKMGLSVTIRSCVVPFSAFKAPMPKEALNRLGLDGYAIEYLEGPEPVLAMLCAERKLHASAIALRDISDEQFNQIQLAENINHFAAGKQLYRTTRRREYGPHAVSTRVIQFAKGRFWNNQPVDAAEKTELEQKLAEIRQQRAEFRNKWEIDEARRKAMSEEVEEIKNAAVCELFLLCGLKFY